MHAAVSIKSTLEEKSCPVHDIRPVIDITGNEIEITCCCNRFQDRCIRAARSWLKRMNLRRQWVLRKPAQSEGKAMELCIVLNR